MSVQKPANSKGTFAKSTIGLLLVCVVAAAMLVAARRPKGLTPTASMDQAEAALPLTPPPTAPAQKKAAVTKPASKAPAAKKTTAAVPEPAAKPAPEMTVMTSTQVADAEIKPVPQESAKLAAPAASPVTIAGCVERDGDGFALKETSGVNAPKSRSWKSGFLKKGTAKIELLDSGNRLKFKDHVGHRISVTGILTDKEMQARSMARVAGACD
jgi:outer membrane biosynthesis protein TonB